MRFFSVILSALALAMLFGLFGYQSTIKKAQADCNGDPQSCLDQVASQISQLETQLNDAKSQEKTLKSQLDYIDAQTKLTLLKIDQANYQVAKLDKEISDLSSHIDRLSGTIDSISQILLTRITQTYKYGNISTIDLLFSSNGFSDLLERLKYIEVAQASDKQTLYALQATKATFHDQKTDRQQRQDEETKLKSDLTKYSTDLDQQKQAKNELLRITQNNEAVYQAKLQAAISEQNAILSILHGGGNEVAVGPVKKGDTVGYIISGSSACSNGTHLHFEVHVNGNLINPATLLSNHDVTWDNKPDSTFSFSGSWDWPVPDPVYIEQGFGNTWYAQHGWYTNPPGHTGIDMYSPNSLAVRAIHDGTLSTGGIACGGGTLHYKKVDHGDGTSSYYLHTT
jgi:peptidoglycan hydrolase CwlO-like protein